MKKNIKKYQRFAQRFIDLVYSEKIPRKDVWFGIHTPEGILNIDYFDGEWTCELLNEGEITKIPI